MDVMVCNGLGIYLGIKTLDYLKMKPYHWRGMWSIPSYRWAAFYLVFAAPGWQVFAVYERFTVEYCLSILFFVKSILTL